jgi:endonuclease/exonuclease/phosphatase family metal-dependent hydrolase
MTEAPQLRLLTYNVRSLRDDPEAVARVIRSVEPHVVCVQEAPRLLRWRAKCAALARRSGLVVVTGGHPAAGNLILSSLGVDVLTGVDQLFSRLPAQRTRHQRGVALARLRWLGHTFVVGGTHLDLAAEPRLHQISELESAINAIRGPGDSTIIAGDMNDEPGSATWQALVAERVDAFAQVGAGAGPTFTAANPTRRIDGVFLGAGVTARSAVVIDDESVRRASDHRPVLVQLEFEPL